MMHSLQGGPSTTGSGGQGRSARYVYCVFHSEEVTSLGPAGLEGDVVYSVATGGLSALVHDCPPVPYRSSDGGQVASWVLAHHRVVEAAWKRWGTVLPLAFNTIIVGDHSSAPENLATWLRSEGRSLESRLRALKGKSEYGVQVFWDLAAAAAAIASSDPEVTGLQRAIEACSPGKAHMYRRQLERALKHSLESRAAQRFEEVYGSLSRCADNVRVEKTVKGGEGRQMVLNLSCLVDGRRLPDLVAQLDMVGAEEGVSVRLAGPLPPYSFC